MHLSMEQYWLVYQFKEKLCWGDLSELGFKESDVNTSLSTTAQVHLKFYSPAILLSLSKKH